MTPTTPTPKAGQPTCSACTTALRTPRINEFTMGCGSCKARALAGTGAHLESAEAGKLTAQYRGALDALFGEGWRAGADEVKAWAGRMKRC